MTGRLTVCLGEFRVRHARGACEGGDSQIILMRTGCGLAIFFSGLFISGAGGVGGMGGMNSVMNREIHLTKKDFRVEWFSGTGAGGQYRNKHQNCCRITHIESGLVAIATDRERTSNQKNAFHALAKKVLSWTKSQEALANGAIGISKEVIRNYNESRNEVHDKASGFKMPYVDVVGGNCIGPMIEARRLVAWME